MSYRVDFWLNSFAAFAVELAVAYFLWKAIFAGSGQEVIAGYTLPDMVIYYVVVLMVGRLARGRERDITVSQDIYEGGLTRYLLYPAPYTGFKYAEQVGALLPSLLQVGAILAFFALPFANIVSADLEISATTVALTVPAVLLANLLWFVTRLPIQFVSFWSDNVWSLNVLLRFTAEILGGMMIPLAVFPEATQAFLSWLPFRFFFSFPTRTLLGEVSQQEWWMGMALLAGWCVVMSLLAAIVWKRGQKTYTGVGI
ncbi:MAG: ABC-2 family transporter protein [Thermoanaerobaculia bacterium]|nr:ABC-2 family transporter protein [Thermoanaerobaculia bacterium]